MEYLTPFIEVIRSPEISGPITGVALTAVSRFLDAYIIGELQDCVLGLSSAADLCCNPCNEDSLSVQLPLPMSAIHSRILPQSTLQRVQYA